MNYTLRRVTAQGMQLNIMLGKHYSTIVKESNPKEFEQSFVNHYGTGQEKLFENTFAVVYAEDSEPHFLSKSEKIYIMTAGGSTFDNLTFKD